MSGKTRCVKEVLITDSFPALYVKPGNWSSGLTDPFCIEISRRPVGISISRAILMICVEIVDDCALFIVSSTPIQTYDNARYATRLINDTETLEFAGHSDDKEREF